MENLHHELWLTQAVNLALGPLAAAILRLFGRPVPDPSHVIPDYLAMLQFFLNHRRYLRSEHRHRVDKSPTELLTGEPHRHWLELLGYTRFARN